MITRIKLKNWKSHLDSELSFSKGVNALIGIMGSGKTSVMQAIAFALFGTLSGVGSRKIGLDDLIMKKPQEKDFASVELEFFLNGKNYVVKRVLEKGKGTGSAEIREGNKLIEVNPKGVTREIERILQMDYDLFQRAVYSEQNALDYFLQIPKGKRMQQIDNMLKLDRYEKARESSVSIRNKIFERRKERLRVIEDMKERKLDDKIGEIEKEIKKNKKESVKIKDGITKAEYKRKKLSERVVIYESEQDMLNEILKKIEAISSRISEMGRQIGSKKLKIKGMRIDKEVLKELSHEIIRFEAKLEEKGNEIRILRDMVSSKNSNILFFRDQIKEAKSKISESRESEIEMKKLEKLLGETPEKTLEELVKNVESLKKRLYYLEARKNEIARGLTELKEAGKKCPVCESDLTKDRKKELMDHRVEHMGETEVKVKDAEKELSNESQKLDSLRENTEAYNEIKKSLKGLDSLRQSLLENEGKSDLLRREVRKIVTEIRRKEREEKNLRKSLEKTKVDKSRMEDLLKEKKELEDLVIERSYFERERKDLESEKKELQRKMKGKEISSMRNELQEVVGIWKGLETKLKDMEYIRKDKLSLLKDLEEQRALFIQYKEEVAGYEKIIDSMDSFISVLRNTQDQLRDEFLKTINYIMNDVWEELYPYGDFSEIRILVEKDYVLQLKGTRGWVSVDLVSGGERSLASLALRIAFSLAFTPNLRWLILDEPTHNLDVNAIEHFGGVLKDRMENIIDQVFLITHEERLSDYIAGSMYKLERDKEIDGVTKIVAS